MACPTSRVRDIILGSQRCVTSILARCDGSEVPIAQARTAKASTTKQSFGRALIMNTRLLDRDSKFGVAQAVPHRTAICGPCSNTRSSYSGSHDPPCTSADRVRGEIALSNLQPFHGHIPFSRDSISFRCTILAIEKSEVKSSCDAIKREIMNVRIIYIELMPTLAVLQSCILHTQSFFSGENVSLMPSLVIIIVCNPSPTSM